MVFLSHNILLTPNSNATATATTLLDLVAPWTHLYFFLCRGSTRRIRLGWDPLVPLFGNFPSARYFFSGSKLAHVCALWQYCCATLSISAILFNLYFFLPSIFFPGRIASTLVEFSAVRSDRIALHTVQRSLSSVSAHRRCFMRWSETMQRYSSVTIRAIGMGKAILCAEQTIRRWQGCQMSRGL